MTRAVFAMAICLLLSGCAPYNQSYWSGYPEYGEYDDSFYARLHEELLYRQLSAPRYNNG